VSHQAQDLLGRLAAFPRRQLIPAPTPLQKLSRLSAALGGPDIFIKRDDSIPLGLGGNKVRKLEYLVGDALRQGADTLITCGAVQSNHARLTAAAANASGMACDIVLVDRVARQDRSYRRSGNRLLLDLLGATVHDFPADADNDLNDAMEVVAARVRARGGRPYIVAEGGGSATGGLGYTTAAAEILGQANEQGLRFSELFVGSGSGGTHAGLLAGSTLIEAPWRVTGVCVRRDELAQAERISRLTRDIVALLGYDRGPPANAVRTTDAALGPGYGQVTEAVHEAIAMLASLEGIFLDPVYTGKVMAGLIAAVRQGQFRPEEQVLFVHTGGSPALFAYLDAFEDRASQSHAEAQLA